MKQKFTSTIAGASIFISILGLMSRGLGFLREMIFASYFGLETDFDLYLVGAVLPITINTIILFIGQNYFVPAFQKVNSSNPADSKKFYNQSFILFIGAGTLIAIILLLFSDQIINIYMHSAAPDSRQTAIQIFKIILITIPFSAGISILSALLLTVFEFKYPSISILFLNISIILLILIFTDNIGVYVIPVGYALGTFLQFCYLLIKSREFVKLNIITYLREYRSVKLFMGSSILIIILIEAISQFYSIFDRYFYGQISSGGIASLNYAYTIFMLPIAIVSISLATAVFPKITQAINETSGSEIERIYNESISINLFIFMPLTFILFHFGDTLIQIAFERGKFITESTAITHAALKCYVLSFTFYSAYAVLNKIFYSLNLTKVLLSVTIMGILIKIILNFLLVEEFQQNGLAVSTSISYLFFFLASYFILNGKLKIKDKILFFKDFVVYFVNCVVCLLIILIILSLFPKTNIVVDLMMIFLFTGLYIVNLIFARHKSIAMIKIVTQNLNLNLLARRI